MKTIETPTQAYIKTLQSQLPIASDLIDLCTALHAAMVDAPEMLWLDVSFEDMADKLTNAAECLGTPDPTLEDLNELADMRRREKRDLEAEKYFEVIAA
jgi:hypothetical protein